MERKAWERQAIKKLLKPIWGAADSSLIDLCFRKAGTVGTIKGIARKLRQDANKAEKDPTAIREAKHAIPVWRAQAKILTRAAKEMEKELSSEKYLI